MLEPRRQHLLCGYRIRRRQCKVVVIGLRHERILGKTNSAVASFLSLIKKILFYVKEMPSTFMH